MTVDGDSVNAAAPRAVALGHVRGTVEPGFETVAEAFEQNFVQHAEIGAAVCVHWHGSVVVDLWGGVADVTSARPYGPDTLQVIFSASKGVLAVLVNLFAERGVIDLDMPIARYWPEFATAGKESVTCRHVLSHTAGLAAIRDRLRLRDALAWQPVVDALASQPPERAPGRTHGYHAFTFGWILGEVLLRVTGSSVGELIQREISGPLGLDLWVGLPATEQARVAPLLPAPAPGEGEAVDELALAISDPATFTHAVFTNPPFPVPAFNSTRMLEAEVPAANAVTSARSLSRLYAACIGDVAGSGRLLQPATVESMRATHAEGPDYVLPRPTHYGLGFQLATALRPLAGPGSFGHYGMGGSVGLAHPDAGLALAYVMNQMQSPPAADPRTAPLITAALASASAKLGQA